MVIITNMASLSIMETVIETIQFLYQYIVTKASPFDLALLAVNILLVCFARPIVSAVSQDSKTDTQLTQRVRLLRGLNLLLIAISVGSFFFGEHDNAPLFQQAVVVICILYAAHFLNYLFQYLIESYYGKKRVIANKLTVIPTYQTRLLSIFVAIFITVVALILIVQQLGFDSLLKAGGAIGIIGVILGLTQASWAPDIISGLIILNSDMLEEGDIIELENGSICRVFKTKLFHTQLLNIRNNHRVMVRNVMLREMIIYNLSRFSSAKGLRECLPFHIGYEWHADRVRQTLIEAMQNLPSEISEQLTELSAEVVLLDTGDHALKWGLLYYLKKVENVVQIRRTVREVVLAHTTTIGMSLATPITLDVDGIALGSDRNANAE